MNRRTVSLVAIVILAVGLLIGLIWKPMYLSFLKWRISSANTSSVKCPFSWCASIHDDNAIALIKFGSDALPYVCRMMRSEDVNTRKKGIELSWYMTTPDLLDLYEAPSVPRFEFKPIWQVLTQDKDPLVRTMATNLLKE